jgi:hypothetical protein
MAKKPGQGWEKPGLLSLRSVPSPTMSRRMNFDINLSPTHGLPQPPHSCPWLLSFSKLCRPESVQGEPTDVLLLMERWARRRRAEAAGVVERLPGLAVGAAEGQTAVRTMHPGEAAGAEEGEVARRSVPGQAWVAVEGSGLAGLPLPAAEEVAAAQVSGS